MQIAVFAGSGNVGSGLEEGDGTIGRREFASQYALVGEQLYPLDVVLGGHGMLDATYGDAVTTVNALDYGHVLLLGGIGGVGFEQLHGLSAAHERAGASMQYFYDVAADGATGYLSDCHHILSFL